MSRMTDLTAAVVILAARHCAEPGRRQAWSRCHGAERRACKSLNRAARDREEVM